MKGHGLFVFVLICLLVWHDLASAEIHRAKSIKTKHRRDGQYASPRGSSRGWRDRKVLGHPRETWIYGMGSACLVGLCGIFPLVVIPIETGRSMRKEGPAAARLKLLLSFAVGGLLGDVFLHLMPEAWKHVHQGEDELAIGCWVIAGILTFLIIEKAFPDQKADQDEDEEQDEGEKKKMKIKESCISGSVWKEGINETVTNGFHNCTSKKHGPPNGLHKNGIIHWNKSASSTRPVRNGHITSSNMQRFNSMSMPPEEQHIKTSGWLNLMANMIDNFTHGLALAGSYCISTKSGMLTTAIILLHEIPHEVGDFAILLRAGFSRWDAAKAQLLTASGGLLGAVTALAAESAQAAGDSVAWILPFTSGGFIYVALVTVVPDLVKEENPWESLKQLMCLCSGIIIMAFIALYFDENDYVGAS